MRIFWIVIGILAVAIVGTRFVYEQSDNHVANATESTATASATPSPATFTPLAGPQLPDPGVYAALVPSFPTHVETPTPAPILAPAPSSGVSAASLVHTITLDELDRYAAIAGWDVTAEPWHLMRRIISECEARSLNIYTHNSSDPQGGSHGLAQLNGSYWFERYGEDFNQRYDPVVNLRTARKLYEERGRFGGGGGWSCADHLGIY